MTLKITHCYKCGAKIRRMGFDIVLRDFAEYLCDRCAKEVLTWVETKQ